MRRRATKPEVARPTRVFPNAESSARGRAHESDRDAIATPINCNRLVYLYASKSLCIHTMLGEVQQKLANAG